MKTLTLVAALAMLTGCQGFMGLDHDSAKYIAGRKHEALAQCVAARSKGYKAEMVVAKNAKGKLTAWAEVEGVPVQCQGKPRRLLPNPRWPRAMFVATKRGTPRELGLYGSVAAPSTRRWLLHTSEHKRLIGHYEACKAMHPATVVATDGTHYWLEATVNGKVYAETTRQGHLDHYDKEMAKGCTVVWRGTLAEYEALGNKPANQATLDKARKEAKGQLATIPPSYWWKR